MTVRESPMNVISDMAVCDTQAASGKEITIGQISCYWAAERGANGTFKLGCCRSRSLPAVMDWKLHIVSTKPGAKPVSSPG